MRISDWSSDVCSSDLPVASARTDRGTAVAQADLPGRPLLGTGALLPAALAGDRLRARRPEVDGGLRPPAGADRSEEHTSELQSLMRISYAVFCLTKKTNTTDS